MADPLRPMKTFLGKTMICGFVAILPITILEGMWSAPNTRELARKIDGTSAMWIAYAVYLLLIVGLWTLWVIRPKGLER